MQNMFGNNTPNNNWMNPLMYFGNNGMTGMNIGGNQFWENIYGNGMNLNMLQNMNMNMQNMNMNMQNMNMQQNMNQQSFSNDKANVVFKTTQGLKINMFVDFGTSISDTILLFLKRVGKPELFHPNSGIYFICNAKKVNIYDQTKIENTFGHQINPVIIVNDVKNLIGA